MIPRALIPFCSDCGPGHPICEYPLRVQAQVSQAPTTPINMIGTISHSHFSPTNVITASRPSAQGINPEETTRSREVVEPQAKKDTPIYYPDL